MKLISFPLEQREKSLKLGLAMDMPVSRETGQCHYSSYSMFLGMLGTIVVKRKEQHMAVQLDTNIKFASARNQDGRLELFARGADQALWHIWQVAPNGGWSGWESLGGELTSNPT